MDRPFGHARHVGELAVDDLGHFLFDVGDRDAVFRHEVGVGHVVTEAGVSVGDIEDEIRAIVDENLADVTGVTKRAIEGDISTF